LVTGGSSYLGHYLLPAAAEQFNLVAACHTHPQNILAGKSVSFDLTNQADVRRVITQLRPQAIIHAAAINPGQGDAARMTAVNTEGSRFVAQAAAEVGARLVHVSTDVVHDGHHAPYSDDAPPAPLNDYGRSKAAAEAAVLAACPQAAVVRISLIYGLSRMDRGTAGFVQRLESGQTLTLWRDVLRQPVWAESLAAALLKLVNLDFAGTLNVAGRQVLTREEFGRKMLAWWNVDPAGRLESGRAAGKYNSVPLDLRLRVERAESLLGMRLPGVDEVLETAPANRLHGQF